MSEILALEHIGIAVHDGRSAIGHFEAIGFKLSSTEDVDYGIRSHIMKAGSACLEILTSTSEDSSLARFLKTRGEGLHHLCLRVGSLNSATAAAEAAECALIGTPSIDNVGHRIFVHPGSNHGVLMGLVQPHTRNTARRIDPGWTDFMDKTYAPAVGKKGEVIAVSGLNALDAGGQIQSPDDIVGQARIIYQKLGEILTEAGATPSDVIKTTDYITDRAGYRATAKVRREFFGDHRPAATGIVVSELFGRGVLIEVEALCVI